MKEADLKLALALLEKECPDLFTEHGRPRHERKGWSCILCGNSGKVPLLDPALVRKPCTCRPPELVHSETGPCRGKGWVPSPNEMDWVRALNKAGYSVTFWPRGRVAIDSWPDQEINSYGDTFFEAAAQALGVCATQGENGCLMTSG